MAREPLPAASPFLSARARERAPQVLAFAAVTGAAILVGPSGRVALVSGAAPDVELERVARLARVLGAAEREVSFRDGLACVHAAPVAMGWVLCAISVVAASPVEVAARVRRASAVLALALADGIDRGGSGSPPGGGGAPAEVRVAPRRPRS